MRHLVTGGAGFIGSNIVETLLPAADEIVILDNLSTGKLSNVTPFLGNGRCTFIEGSITDRAACKRACRDVDYVYHEAALISVPSPSNSPRQLWRSTSRERPMYSSPPGMPGETCCVCLVNLRVWQSRCLSQHRDPTPQPLIALCGIESGGEMLASAFTEVYGIPVICLKVFQCFRKRQDPSSAYAASYHGLCRAILGGEQATIFGDGEQTRDFVYIDNVVEANIKAAMEAKSSACGRAFNIGCGESNSINHLYAVIAKEFGK